MMLSRLTMTGVLAAAWMASAYAADATLPVLTPGRYMSSVTPGFNREVANHIEESLQKIPELTAVSAQPSDNTIHFAVKDGARVDAQVIQKSLQSIDSTAVMTTPMLEHTLNADPGQ